MHTSQIQPVSCRHCTHYKFTYLLTYSIF